MGYIVTAYTVCAHVHACVYAYTCVYVCMRACACVCGVHGVYLEFSIHFAEHVDPVVIYFADVQENFGMLFKLFRKFLDALDLPDRVDNAIVVMNF